MSAADATAHAHAFARASLAFTSIERPRARLASLGGTPRATASIPRTPMQLVLVRDCVSGLASAFCVQGRAPLPADELAAWVERPRGDTIALAAHRLIALDDASLARFVRLFARADARGAELVAARIEAFESALQPAWLETCPREHPARYLAYNRLAALAPASRERLIEATRAYGFLWPLLLAANAEAARIADCIADCIERAEPLAPLLSEVLAAAPWQVRALQRAFSGALSSRDMVAPATLGVLLQGLGEIAPERAPATRAGWLYLLRAAESTDQRGWLGTLAEIGFDRLADGKGLPRAWRRFARIAGLKRQLSDLRDLYAYAAQYEDRVWLPAGHERDLRAVLEVFDRWKAVIDPLAGAGAQPTHLRGTWTPLLAAPQPVDGLVAHELADAAALREDGFLMKHCIGGYAQLCEEKGSRIMSLRDAHGRRVSTFQVHFLKGAWRVLQHRGKANTTPSAAATRAAAALADWLNANTV